MKSPSKVFKKKVEEKVQVYRTQSYWDLFDAISQGSEEKLTEVLNTTLDAKTLLQKKDLQGLTPLKKAIALSKSDIARILVSYGAEPSIRDPLGRTVLHVAAMQGRCELIAPLLVSSDSSVNVQDNEGWTPLHLAVRGQHEKAINWLLYAGADIHLKNKNDVAPIDMCDEDSPIRQMLERQAYNLDDCPVELCSAFIGPKQLNLIGSNGNLMFVTSGLWSEEKQFFFNVRIRPHHADPKFPLRQDEMFFNDVCRYRMMYHLPPGRSRVHAYFLSFEHFRSDEVILKITSKTKFLGEVPVSLSTYTQDNFICFLASAELDLKDAGQFVLVKRSSPVLLTKGPDGIYSSSRHPKFKFDIPANSLPGPPPNWETNREERARAEIDTLLRKLQLNSDPELVQNKNKNADQSESERIGNEEVEGAKENAETLLGDSEEAASETSLRRLKLLDGDEPDQCEDFYFISKGWGLYLEYRRTLPLALLLEKIALERNIIVCNTDFYKIFHTSLLNPKYKCRVQIPKTEDFVKTGTVLVFRRTELKPGEEEFPDPDDEADEHFLSQDGKNVWGTFWLNKEKERWSLIPSGIVNKRTRVIFETDTFSTFIVVQLKTGTQKWEPESDDEASSDEETEKEKIEATEKPEGEVEGEGEGEGEVQRESESATQVQRKESGSQIKKKQKKRGEPDEFIVDYGDDDVSVNENELLGSEEEQAAATDEDTKKSSSLGEDSAQRKTEAAGASSTPQAKGPESQHSGTTQAEKKDENASNLNRNNPAEDLHENKISDVNKNTSNKQKEDTNSNNDQLNDNDDEENLAPEERTIFKNLEPATSSYAVVVGVPQKPVAVIPAAPETPAEEQAEEVVEEQDGAEKEEVESDEDLPRIRQRLLSLGANVAGKIVQKHFRFGPPLSNMGLQEADESFIKNSIALMWRYRNHREVTAAVFSSFRDGGFDLVIEIVKTEDLYIRAEHWWSQDYKMVAESSTFPVKSGRLFSFAMDGTMLVENPPGSSIGYIMTRSMYCYFSQINSLQYFVKRGISSKEEEKGQKKGPKKKDDPKAEHTEPDAVLEITGYPRGTRTNGVDIVLMPIFLNGPDLWNDRHVALRLSDNVLLSRLVKFLRKETELVKRWWKAIIMLGYPEKMVEAEKGKNKPGYILATFLKKWFQDNLNSRDRGILTLVGVLETMELESAITGVIDILKTYKAHLLTVKNRPRYLKLLFHWVLQTKITRNSLIRMMGPPIMKPVSDMFLLRLSELLSTDQLFKIGACMDIEDNVIHAIAGEEVITDPEYLPFRVFIKSRQKKDEIIHYTLLLMAMVKQCQEPEAKSFIVNETRKWMETVVDTEPEMCAKLNNIFD